MNSRKVSAQRRTLFKGGTALAAALLTTAVHSATWEWTAASGLFPQQLPSPPQLFSTDTNLLPTLSNGVLTIKTTTNTQNIFYLQPACALRWPETLVIEARLRVVSSVSFGANRAAGSFGFTSNPGVGKTLYLGENEIFFPLPAGAREVTARVDTSDFHTYRLEVTGRAAGSVVRIYYDNVLALTGSSYFFMPDNGDSDRIFWGEDSFYAYGQLEWVSLRHNALADRPPSLAIDMSGSDVEISFPQSAGDFALEWTDSLKPPVAWQVSNAARVLVNGSWRVTFPRTVPPAPAAFFRLRCP